MLPLLNCLRIYVLLWFGDRDVSCNYFENTQHTSFTYIFIWVRKLDSNSLKFNRQKWSYWDLWQASSFVTTKQMTTYAANYGYRQTRQDRWIQAELAFSLAKNATKPNPFEIIPLQTTRKENNWKTEEALVRTAVNLETERIKGSNPWSLWWWWWW